VVTYTECVGCQPINDYRRPVVIGDVYRPAADTRDQGHRSRRPGIGRQPIPFTFHQSQKRLKLEHIKCSESIPCLRHLRQLMNSTILAGQHGKVSAAVHFGIGRRPCIGSSSGIGRRPPPCIVETKNYRLPVESLGSTREPCGRQNKKHANEDYQGPTPKEILTPP
jgi:hypothetical protein